LCISLTIIIFFVSIPMELKHFLLPKVILLLKSVQIIRLHSPICFYWFLIELVIILVDINLMWFSLIFDLTSLRMFVLAQRHPIVGFTLTNNIPILTNSLELLTSANEWPDSSWWIIFKLLLKEFISQMRIWLILWLLNHLVS
jgi:hypothetical protein